MKTVKRIITLSMVSLLLNVLGTSIVFAGKLAGGGGKVSVDSANPNSAIQGEEKVIYITGSGFGPGASVRYLVTGTDDDTQIEVLGTEYIESTGELKTHVKVKDAAAVVDYDIEVQAASGRKGKGTTLFKVNLDAPCIDTEFPTFAFSKLTSTSNSGRGRNKDPITTDVLLTGNNGCTSYPLMSAYTEEIRDLKFTLKQGLGVVTWVSKSEPDELGVSIHRIMAVYFDVLPGNVISPAQPQPVILHEALQGTAENIYIGHHNIFLDNELNLHVAFTYIHPGTGGETGLQILDVDSGVSQVLLSGQYHFLDDQSTPYRSTWSGGSISWSPDGSELYFSASRTDDEYFEPGVARMTKINGEWQQPQLVVVNHQSTVGFHLRFAGPSLNGILAYGIEVYDGKNWNFYVGLLDPDECLTAPCDVLDGAPPVGVERRGTPVTWTLSGSLLFERAGYLGEYTDPYLGIFRELVIDGADPKKLDSSY